MVGPIMILEEGSAGRGLTATATETRKAAAPPPLAAAPSLATTTITACGKVKAEADEKFEQQKKRNTGRLDSTQAENGSKPSVAFKNLNRPPRRVLRDSIRGITKSDIRRLARRGGVKRLNKNIYWEAQYALKTFLEDVIWRASTYTEHDRRWTISAMDVVRARKAMGATLYGYGG